MNLWLMAGTALAFAVAGIWLGRQCSKLRSPYWTVGYFLPLAIVFVFAVVWRIPSLTYAPPFSWFMLGPKKFVVFGFVATMLLTTPLSRVPQRRLRLLVCGLMGVIVFFMAIWPFIAPMVDRRQLSRLHTEIDKDGVCLQTTDYTCGPAAAVTVLRKLGLPAEEGQIAILSYTSGQEGTSEDMLADGLAQEYGSRGILAECRVFHSVAELQQACPVLAVVKYSLLVDHWVAVLDVTGSEVVVGDPLGGLVHMTHEEFAERWRFVGIVVRRQKAR